MDSISSNSSTFKYNSSQAINETVMSHCGRAFISVVLFSQTLSRLSCAYKKENQTKMVVCDLGNPMKGGTKVSDHCCRITTWIMTDDNIKYEEPKEESNRTD